MISVFVSYKRDHPASEALVDQIEKQLAGTFSVLRDQGIPVGARWSKELYGWLLECRAAIVIISKEANASDWCRREWGVRHH